MGDASEPLGGTIAAACRAKTAGVTPRVAFEAIQAEVERRHARNENLPFGGLLTVSHLGSILQNSSTPQQINVVVELIARVSTPPPAGYVHVFAVAAGEVLSTVVPVVRLCDCGHPLAEHDDKGACTFLGVPHGPMLGLPEPMAARARELGIPMRCPCAGPVMCFDASGRLLPE